MALSPEILVPRLGDALVVQGLLTVPQLDHALEVQKAERLEGKSPLIGQVLIELGYIDKPTLDQAVIDQIFTLQNALKLSNQNLERRVQERTAELEKAYQKLSELSKLKANFLSNISHELRTPMTHVKGYVELLLAGDFGILNNDQKQAVEVLKRASERLGRLIDDLILFSTAEHGSIQIKISPVDIVSVSKTVIERNIPQASQKNIRLWLDCNEDKIPALADPDRLDWVLNQLVENAVKYTQPSGEVYVRLVRTVEDVTVSIVDSGIGINPSQIDEIFEPFHQLDGSSTRAQGGTGLGLTLAKKIIEAHGSKIKVSSVPGKGSKFEFQLRVQAIPD